MLAEPVVDEVTEVLVDGFVNVLVDAETCAAVVVTMLDVIIGRRTPVTPAEYLQSLQSWLSNPGHMIS